MKLSDILPSVFTDGDDPEVQITTKKYSQFPPVEGPGIQGVGLKDGQNVRFELTTDAVAVNPNTFRNAKGEFIGTPEELEALKNQRDVNEFLYNAINDIEQGDIDLEGYATEAQLEEVDRNSQERDDDLEAQLKEVDNASVFRDEALKAQADEWDVLNTAAHLKLEDQILRSYAWSQGDNEKLEDKLTKVDEDLQAQIDTNKTQSEDGDKHLQVEIEELALALETLLLQKEHGQWVYVGFTGDTIPRNAGEFSLAVADIASSQENIITINQEDLKGITHGFGDTEVGDYVEIVNTEDPSSYALFVVTKAPEGTGIVNVEVALKDTGYNIWNGETCEIRFFAINEQDINLTELDDRYVSKTAGDQTMKGPLAISGLGTWKGSRIKLDYVTANSDTGAVKLGTPSNEQNLRVYDDKVQVLDVPLCVKTLNGFADGYGASYVGAYEEPDHIATKKDVEAAVAGGGADSGFVQKSGDTMTGILELPRFNVKKHDGEAICLIEGKVDGTATSARLTFSNKTNANAYGNLTWNGNSGQGWFQFNKDVDFSTKNLHSVNNIRLVGNKTIQEAQTTRIQLDGKVVIKKVGTEKAGFVLKGAVSGNSDGNLLSVYHNSSGLDSVDYYGKQEGVNNVATVGYVNSKAKAPLVSHMERLYHKDNQTDGQSFYFQNQYSSPTTAMNDFRKFRWKLPSSHYLQDMVGAGRDMGYIVVCNTGGSLLYQCQVSNAQKDGLYITLDLDSDNHYGSSALGNASWYVVHLFSCLREGQ